MHVADSSSKAPGGYRRLPAGRLKEKRMEMEEVISAAQRLLDEAALASDAGDEDKAFKYLEATKQLLDDEFLAE